MQQAILITAYTNIKHLNDITESLNDNYIFYIHIDTKSDIRDSDIERLSKKNNVAFIKKEYNVNWGGLNHLKAILLLLAEAVKDENTKYFHLITGHDYPIKTANEISSFLEDNENSYMEFNELPYDNWENGGFDRILYYNFHDYINGRKGWKKAFLRKAVQIQKISGIKRKLPNDFPEKIYGGSTYWSLNRSCVLSVFDYMKEHPKYLKRFRHTFCSEEIFFQTILLNSPLKNSILNNNKRFIVWEERNGNYPANLDETDYEKIMQSDAFFARKFEYPVSERLLEKIKKHLSLK
ncbi:MAG: beta-1,6-N-acetylglucosaminyltransferase [Dysgonomonas sp.]